MPTALYALDYPRAFWAGLMVYAGGFLLNRTGDLITAPFISLAVGGHPLAATILSTIVLVILYISFVAAAALWYFKGASGGFLNGLLLGTIGALLDVLGTHFDNLISALIFGRTYVANPAELFFLYSLLIAVSASIGYLSRRSRLSGGYH